MKRNIMDEVEKKREELKELEKELTEFERLPENCRLADIMHEQMCPYNHTDGCSWHYDTWEDAIKGDGHSKKVYLKKANKILGLLDYKLAIKVLKALD